MDTTVSVTSSELGPPTPSPAREFVPSPPPPNLAHPPPKRENPRQVGDPNFLKDLNLVKRRHIRAPFGAIDSVSLNSLTGDFSDPVFPIAKYSVDVTLTTWVVNTDILYILVQYILHANCFLSFFRKWIY
jgi:hypothetical protein